MMRYALLPPLLLLTVALGGCGPNYEQEFLAAQQEISQLKAKLAEAERKLRAADSESRQKILTIARRATRLLQAEMLDDLELRQLQKDLAVHLDSYLQLNSSADQIALIGGFFSDKLTRVLDLQKAAHRAYDRQYNACLSDLASSGKKTDLSTMLCEVQADVARREPHQQFQASVKALLEIGQQMLDGERTPGAATMTMEQAEQRFQGRLRELVRQASG